MELGHVSDAVLVCFVYTSRTKHAAMGIRRALVLLHVAARGEGTKSTRLVALQDCLRGMSTSDAANRKSF
jgi:hypothetical protein